MAVTDGARAALPCRAKSIPFWYKSPRQPVERTERVEDLQCAHVTLVREEFGGDKCHSKLVCKGQGEEGEHAGLADRLGEFLPRVDGPGSGDDGHPAPEGDSPREIIATEENLEQ